MSREQVLGIVRTALAYGAGWATSKGYLDSATAESLVGVGVALAVAAWSFYAKRTK